MFLASAGRETVSYPRKETTLSYFDESRYRSASVGSEEDLVEAGRRDCRDAVDYIVEVGSEMHQQSTRQLMSNLGPEEGQSEEDCALCRRARRVITYEGTGSS